MLKGAPLTPLTTNLPLNQALRCSALALKLEEQHPLGSHKGRSLAFQLEQATALGKTLFVLSSTGNAAIAANALAPQYGAKVITLITDNIAAAKLQHLRASAPYLILTCRPTALRRYLRDHLHAHDLNSTYDDTSCVAYEQIGEELLEQHPTTKAIALFVSSGSALLGIAQAYSRALVMGTQEAMPQLLAVQTLNSHLPGLYASAVPLSGEGDLRDPTLRARQARLSEALRLSSGSVLSVSDAAILQARTLLQQHDQDTSPEGCAVIAAIQQHFPEGTNIPFTVLLTGRATQWATAAATIPPDIPRCGTVAELRDLLKHWGISAQ